MKPEKMEGIFENWHETASQEIFLRGCGFAEQRLLPVPDSEADSLIGEDLVESQAIRLVSPPQSKDTVDTEEEGGSIANHRDEKKKLQIPLRDVVKAIVMNSRNMEEEEEKESCVQILLKKGFNFPLR